MEISPIKKTVVITLFLCTVSMAFLTPIKDHDVFWHLATGRWIAEHKALPASDPFSYTTSLESEGDFLRTKILLTAYWLANLCQFGIFSIGGFYGIIALRILIVLSTLLVLALHMRKKGLHTLATILLLLPVAFVLAVFPGDRPNQITFIFTVLFMFLLDSLRRGERKGYLLPLILTLWANMHGGFILGTVIAAIMALSELIRKWFLRDYILSRPYVAVLLLTIGAGFLHPTGYDVLYSMFFETSASYTSGIAEFNSPWIFTKLGEYSYIWIMSITIFLSSWYFLFSFHSKSLSLRESILNRIDELLLFCFLAAISFTAVRYIPLFILVMAPIVAILFAGKFQDMIDRLARYLIPEIVIIAMMLWWIYANFSNTVFKLPLVQQYFPDDAVQFIKQKDMKGRFYNFYDWGGYLIWQFYPEKFVFIDNRALSMSAFHISEAIFYAKQDMYDGKPLYRAMLDTYSVRHILIPAVTQHGDMVNLLRSLESDQEWQLIFIGRNSLIYTRDEAKESYPKSLAYTLALSNALEIINETPDNPMPYLTFARANLYVGRRAGAINGLEIALKNRPSLRGGPVERAWNLLREGRDITK